MLIRPKYTGLLIPPAGFSIDIPCNVYWNGENYITNLNRFLYKITPETIYYVATYGSNSLDGLNEGTALATGNAAVALGNATNAPYEVRFIEGLFDRSRLWSTTPTQPANFVAWGGRVSLTARQALTFTNTIGNVYKATRSSISSEFDEGVLDEFGDPTRCVPLTSEADVAEQPASFYTNDVDVWIHAADSRNLQADPSGIINNLKINPPTLTTSNNIYVEGIDFDGFQLASFVISNSSPNDDITAYFYNCGFSRANTNTIAQTNGNGLSILGAKKVILDSCVTTQSFLDGNNYHFKNEVIPHIIEYNCTVRNSGYSTISPEANNASTLHDGARGLRIGCDYGWSSGRNVHDVSGVSIQTQSWNIGCISHDSKALRTTGGANWACGDGIGAKTKMWLTNCESEGSVEDYIINSGDTLLYNLGSQTSGWTGVNNGGTLSTFTQGF